MRRVPYKQAGAKVSATGAQSAQRRTMKKMTTVPKFEVNLIKSAEKRQTPALMASIDRSCGARVGQPSKSIQGSPNPSTS